MCMVTKMLNIDFIKELLTQIPDPEIPVINIVELGIVRDIAIQNDHHVSLTITPTYSACPAMFTIEDDIKKLMATHDVEVEIITKIAPVWTTDWITEEAREKLRNYGIVPPEKGNVDHSFSFPKKCPRCQSLDTKQLSRFGSTLCKASYVCNSCLEPFDYFKCH